MIMLDKKQFNNE